MAEITAFYNNALPYPIYGEQYTVTFPMLDADGDLVTGATTPDAERSINGDTFADCSAESTELATNSGMYYLTLTATEMTANILTVIAKSATAGMKTTALTLYPRVLTTVRTGTCNDDGSGTSDVVLDAGASAIDDFYNGMVISVVIDGGASGEVRFITDYTGSTKTATVHKAFTAAVDNTDTFTIYLPEAALINQANLTHIAGAAVSTSTAQLGVNVVNNAGSAITSASGRQEVNLSHIAGSAVSTTTAQLGVNVVQISTDATAADNAEAFFDGTGYAGTNNVIPLVTTTTTATTATNVTTVNGLAANVITAAATAADFGTEIGTAVWASASRELTALDEDNTTIDLNATAVGSVAGAVGSVTGNVGGNVTGSVGSVVGLTASNLDVAVSTLATAAALDTVDNFLDTEIAAIKTKTDQLTFTSTNELDVNIHSVNDVAVTGTGALGDEWGP